MGFLFSRSLYLTYKGLSLWHKVFLCVNFMLVTFLLQSNIVQADCFSRNFGVNHQHIALKMSDRSVKDGEVCGLM